MRSYRPFWIALSRAQVAAWRRLHDGTIASDFWSLYHRIRLSGGVLSVEGLRHDDRFVITNLRRQRHHQ